MDNLENITEDEDGQDGNSRPEDDDDGKNHGFKMIYTWGHEWAGFAIQA